VERLPPEALERLMPQEHIARNRRDTALVILFMFMLLWGIVFALGWLWGTPPIFSGILAFLVAGTYIAFTTSFSVKEVLRATRARPVNPNVRSEKLLQYRVEEMAIASGLPVPKVYVQESDGINAFATGLKPEDSVVCVTTGALEKLDQEELQGVIAHEVAHILNRDMRVTTITIGVVGTIALLSEIAIRSLFFGAGRGRGGGGRGGHPILLVAALVLIILAPIFSRLAYLFLSRKREYLADASGAMLSRNP
jgi:heat shock protein HtpX